MHLRPLVFALSALLLDCATLEAIPEGACGNGVVDTASEDCDTFPASCGSPADGLRACRLKCERRRTDDCPIGWGCSVDGFCREATGEFDPVGDPISAGVVTLVPGDFDGDGRTDLVSGGTTGSAAKARAHFFDGNARAASLVTLEFPATSPVVRDFDHDGIDDLGFVLPGLAVGAFGLLTGRADRTFLPFVFPSISLPRTDARYAIISSGPKEALPNIVGATVIALQRSDGRSSFTNLSADDILGAVRLDMPSPIDPADLVGPLRVARLFPINRESACGEVVGAYNGADGTGRVFVLSPCIGDAQQNEVRWNNAGTPKVYVVGPRIRDGVMLADLDGDGDVEVVVGTEGGVYAAKVDGGNLSAFELDKKYGAFPLVVRDLDRDGTLDVVTPYNVYLGDPDRPEAGIPDGGEGLISVARPLLVWSDVKVGMLNGDDLPDLVAISPDALDIEFFGNAGEGRFTRFVIGSNQPVRATAIGDFDGDRLGDVAYLEAPRRLDDPQGSGPAQLYIAHGKAYGGPEPPRLVGRFENATGLLALVNPSRSVNDLVVTETVRRPDAAADATVTVLNGTGDRATIAPLLMRDGQSQRPVASVNGRLEKVRVWFPVTLSAGPLTTPETVDIAAVAIGVTINVSTGIEPITPVGFWRAKGSRQPNLPLVLAPFREETKLEATFATVDTELLSKGLLEIGTGAASADVDSPPDGVEEIVAMTRTTQGTTAIFVLRAGPLAATQTLPPPIVIPDLVVTEHDDMAMFDATNDGLPDVLLLSQSAGREQILVFPNDGRGGFRPTPIPVRTYDGPNPAAPVAFAPVYVAAKNGKRRVALAVATSRRLFLATLSDDGRVFEMREITNLITPPPLAITSVATGDFDGDGTQDIAIADSGAIRILRQAPRLR